MGVENLARVIGPNVMPPQETTMVAMQSRLEAYLAIVKVKGLSEFLFFDYLIFGFPLQFLIENAEKIGVIPEEINEALSMDSLGSIENDLDQSDHSSFQRKKKKQEAGMIEAARPQQSLEREAERLTIISPPYIQHDSVPKESRRGVVRLRSVICAPC